MVPTLAGGENFREQYEYRENVIETLELAKLSPIIEIFVLALGGSLQYVQSSLAIPNTKSGFRVFRSIV
jgi:hypothetical protein